MSLIAIKYKKSHLYLLLFKLLFLDKPQPCHYPEREQISFCINCFSIDILYYSQQLTDSLKNSLSFILMRDQHTIILNAYRERQIIISVSEYMTYII